MPVKAGPRRRSEHCALVLMTADTQFPSHGHTADEWALLIDGYVRESTGRDLHSGDLLHKPTVSTARFTPWTLPGFSPSPRRARSG